MIEGNYLGTNLAGLAPSANGGNGVSISNSGGNLIGGATAAKRNVIAGNFIDGVRILGATSTLNGIEGNYIGLDRNGNRNCPFRTMRACSCRIRRSTMLSAELRRCGQNNVIAGNAASAPSSSQAATSF